MDDDDELCECGEKECPAAQEILQNALAELGQEKHDVHLFYLSQGDCLSPDQISDIFSGNISGVEEYVLDWWRENDEWAIAYEVEQLVGTDGKEMLESHDLLSELEDAIREKDQSDPFGELVSASADQWVRIWICDVSDECWDDSEVLNWEIDSICRTGGLRRELNEDRIRELLCTDQASGEVCLLFRATMTDLVGKIFGPAEWGGLPADPKFRMIDPRLWIDGYTVELHGQCSAALNISTDPRQETDYDSSKRNSDDFEVVSRFHEYKQELEVFYDYRAKLMEKA